MLSSREVMILFLTFKSLTHLELDLIAVGKDPQKLYFLTMTKWSVWVLQGHTKLKVELPTSLWQTKSKFIFWKFLHDMRWDFSFLPFPTLIFFSVSLLSVKHLLLGLLWKFNRFSSQEPSYSHRIRISYLDNWF